MKQPGEDCAVCGQPDVGNRELAIINLYQRCLEFKALPYSGGVLDQPKYLLDYFDIIDARKRAHEDNKELDANRELVRQQQKEVLLNV